jgi:uncharacterized protein YjdB
VTVSPGSVTLNSLGATRTLTAEVRDANGHLIPGAVVQWSSAEPGVASVGASTGMVTASTTGNATVVATSDGVTGESAITVRQVPATVTVTPPDASIAAIGGSLQFVAVARDSLGSVIPGVQFTWTSSASSVSTVSATGLATAVGAGRATIQATVGTVAGSAALAVALKVSSVTVTPGSASASALGTTRAYSAEARDANGAVILGAIFAWTSSAPAVATVDPASGVATAVSNGTTTITATSGGSSGSATLQVQQVVSAIAVAPPQDTVGPGGTRQLSASALDANGHAVPAVQFAWSTSDATVASVNASGLATGIAVGTAAIRASAGGVTGAALLTVRPVVASVTVSPGAAQIPALGGTVAFSAVARDAGGNVIPGVVFAWSSASPAVASVDPVTGVATGVAAGSTTVTATADGVGGSASLSVVAGGGVASVRVTPTGEVETPIGGTVQFSAQALDAAGNVIPGVTFVWSSTNPGVATVDPVTGLATALANGATFIRATAPGGVTGQRRLLVR